MIFIGIGIIIAMAMIECINEFSKSSLSTRPGKRTRVALPSRKKLKKSFQALYSVVHRRDLNTTFKPYN
jgi:hypothetical protein